MLLVRWRRADSAGGAWQDGNGYFGVAGFILASSIIENSYSLTHHDDCGSQPRRAFNDAVLRLSLRMR
jgi:hypothetical protein